MKQYKTLFTGVLAVGVVIAGFLGIIFVLDMATYEEVRASLTKILMVLGIVTAVSATMIVLQNTNKG